MFMGGVRGLVCGWTWEENKLFELALAIVDEGDPNRWEAVAAIIGGEKSAEEVHRHYTVLVEDLQFIEGGFMDNELELEDDHNQKSLLQVDCSQSIYWTDEDHSLLVQLDIT
ncbi:protein RADIALIS-like 3 [Punica granatum]|uniref:Protein RADIALIS-like 3 n=2 Tax=Punica granatum TaxID=22663 RepID=A0A6P8DNG5_PUNGR|nr:protein RADIALIS-like 3 [Punica granatum]